MPSIRRRGGEAVDDGLDILPVQDEFEQQTVVVRSGASDLGSPDALPPDLLSAPVGMEDDLAHALAARPPRRKLPGLTAFLAAAILIAGGFLGGVITQKHQGGSSTGTGGNAASIAAAFRNRGGTGAAAATTGTGAAAGAGTGAAAGAGAGAGAGAAGGASTTIGTVKLVDGNKIYLTATDGSTIVVTTGASTTIKVTKDGVPADLAPGTTVVVAGTKNAAGVVQATTVTQGGGAGGFGGGGGGFGGGRTRTGTGTGGAGAATGTGGSGG